MKYFSSEFTIQCDSEVLRQAARELLADDLGRLASYESFLDTDGGIEGYVQQSLYDEAAVRRVIEELPIAGVEVSFLTEAVPDEDWNATWEAEGFSPIIIDKEITIYDARRDLSEPLSTPLGLGIEARNAFGTGTHSTTRMIISLLLHTPLQGKRILDCGCGTGILGLTALLLGAGSAVGYDIDEWSVSNARHNALLNGLSDRLTVFDGDSSLLGAQISGSFDIVLANINRNILLNDMERFRSVMAPKAMLIISGFYSEDAPLLINKASSLGLYLSGQREEDNWCCLELKC